MANTIVNLPSSFIQWCESAAESCNDYKERVLPIHDKTELQLMLRIDETTTTYLDTIGFYLIRGAAGVGDAFLATDVVHQLDYQYALVDTGDYAVVVLDESCTAGDLADTVYGAENYECIRLVLAIRSTRVIVCVSTQQFQYIPDTCWTQVIRYGCRDNSYGFLFKEVNTAISAVFYNQIRMPITLMAPRPVTEKDGFEESTGRFKTLQAKKSKEWDVDVDYLNEHQHMCLDAAIDHDELFIFENVIADCAYTSYQYHHDDRDKYDIDWQDKPGQHLGVAKAKFKLMTNPYYSTNNNC